MDYQNGKIYQITDIAYTKCYIGSTTQPLCKRLYHHKKSYEFWKNGSKSKTTSFQLFEEFGVENCIIELIENYPCENKNELTKREGHYIKSTECVNKRIAGRTSKEYTEDNKDARKIYRENNKVTIKQKTKDYAESHKEIIKNYKAEYAKLNKEAIKKYKAEYYKNSKEKKLISAKAVL